MPERNDAMSNSGDAVMAELEALVGDAEIEEVNLDQPEDQTDRLLAEMTLESERPPGQAYSYDRQVAETGRWVKWPKLGEEAYLLLAKTQNRAYTELWDKATQKYGDRHGKIKLAKRLELLPVINGKTLLRGIRGVRFIDGAGASVTRLTVSDADGRRSEVPITVGAAGQQPMVPGAADLKHQEYVADNLNNRVNIMRGFAPDLGNEVFAYCDDEGHYFTGATDEEVRGN